MSRLLLLSLATGLFLTASDARPVAPPPKPCVPLAVQLQLLDVLGGRYELAGRGKDRYVGRLDLSEAFYWDKATFRHLATFDRLERLNLSGKQLTDADIEQVVRVRSLRSLDVSENMDVTDKSARLLATLPHLETLNVYRTLGYEGIAQLGNLRRLKWLKCGRIDDAALAALARCTKLEYLKVKYAELSEKGARAFGSMKQLKELSIRHGKLAPNAQPHLGLLTGLKVLDLGVELSDAGLEAITTLPALEELSLSVDNITGTPSRAALAKVANMKALKLLGRASNDHLLEAVSRCKTIETIYANQCTNVTDAGVAHLVRCPALRELHLGDSAVTDACIPSLIKIKSLRVVYVGITKKGYQRLHKARPDMKVFCGFEEEAEDDPR